MVCGFLQPIHAGINDALDGPSMQGAGPTLQALVLVLEISIGDGVELRVLKGRHSNAEKSCFWWIQLLVLLYECEQMCHYEVRPEHRPVFAWWWWWQRVEHGFPS